ncbi:hypothetical protein, partial [Aeromonas lacus]|uniref:hypothetical protein n=1 Tax=Aeromonas lacus TaxID=558884 RepID=UPI001269EBF5
MPIQTLPGRLPGGSNVPIHTLPAIRQTIHSRLGVLLIRDQVTGSDYVTTLDSSSNVTLPGSPPQAIFGSRVRGQGARKVATWYTHRNDGNVVRIEDFTPREAFVGMTNEHGNSAGLSGDSFTLTNGTQVNPVLSGKAFSELINMPVGSSHELGLTEVLRNGDRQLTTTVYKRAQLELGAAPPQCKDATIEGINGKECVLRTISGANKAADGGDVMFSVEMRARLNTPHARFKVGEAWHPLGQQVPVAEFANAKCVKIFFVPPTSVVTRLHLSELVNVSFSSASRIAKGDRFSVTLQNAGFTPPRSQVLSSLELLTVSDEVNHKQAIITLMGGEHQRITSDARMNGNQVWYLQENKVQPLYPLARLKTLEPSSWFSGVANQHGQVSPLQNHVLGATNPVLSATGVSALNQWATGTQQLVTAIGEYNDGGTVTYFTNLKKQAGLLVKAEPDKPCIDYALNGIKGLRCSLRRIETQNISEAGEHVRVTIKSNQPLVAGHYFLGSGWHLFGDEIMLSSLSNNDNLDVFFVPSNALFREGGAMVSTTPSFSMKVTDEHKVNFNFRLDLNRAT